jgi:two-component system response regulator MprA
MMARILVADDSATILRLLRTRLEMEGHEVETASDGQEVLDALDASAGGPDLLLLDAMMPRISGIDALRRLRAAGVETPALIVSAHRDAGDVEDEGLDIGGYVSKPIDFEALFDRIAELTRPRESGSGPGPG